VSALEWLAPVPLPRLLGGFHDYKRDALCVPQAPFAWLTAIAIFCNEVKGKSALAISRDLGLSYKAAFVLLHKLREAMAEEMKGRKLGGEGIVAEIDGGYFGGYVKPANHVENRRDRRLARNQTGKRKAVVIIRERNGRSLPAVFRTEGQALSFIRSRIAKGTIVNADESNS
jgi:ISXO2-like transposase domain